MGSKGAKYTSLSIPSGLQIALQKAFFFVPATVGPERARPGLPSSSTKYPFWGCFSDKRGQQRAHVEVKAHVECSNRFPSFGRFQCVSGPLWGQNNRLLDTKRRVLGGHRPTWRHCPRVPLVSFWLKIWILQGHHLGSRLATLGKDLRRWDGARAKTEN